MLHSAELNRKQTRDGDCSAWQAYAEQEHGRRHAVILSEYRIAKPLRRRRTPYNLIEALPKSRSKSGSGAVCPLHDFVILSVAVFQA